jgi:FkbM family methyltransferase
MRPATQQSLIDTGRRLSSHLPGAWDRRARELAKIALNYRGARRLAARHVQFALVRHGSPLLVVPFGPGQIAVDPADEEVGRTVFITGGYEREHMAAAVRHLRAAGRPVDGKVFVDAGANIGTSTLDALLQFGFARAVSFEPDAANARLLRLSAQLNDLGPRIEVHTVALSDHDGTVGLRRSHSNSGDHRVVALDSNGHGNGHGPPPPGGETVECRRLDSYFGPGGSAPGDVGLVWVDTQGHEPHVLAGAPALLGAGVPFVVEYCPWVLLEGAAALEAQIADHFSLVVDLREGAELVPADVPRLRARYATRGYTDLLLVP